MMMCFSNQIPALITEEPSYLQCTAFQFGKKHLKTRYFRER
jgi:hypothetical protein